MTTNQSDFEKIEALRRKDIEASKSKDFDTLRSLATEDAVFLPPDGPPVVGKEALAAHHHRSEKAMESVEILEYDVKFEDLIITGDYAFEWGILTGTSRNQDTGELTESVHKVLRILKRQPDGEWKFHRAMWSGFGEEEKG